MKLYAQRVEIDLKFEIKTFSSPFPLNPSFNTSFGKLFYYSIIFVFIFSKISKI